MSHTDRFWYGVIVLWALVALGTLFAACDFPMGIVDGEDKAVPGCALDTVQEPWGLDGGGRAVRTRGFLAEGTHLGLDVALTEGHPIVPLGCGVVRFAGAARGYGTFAVVVEHRLEAGVSLRNGQGERVFVDRFLSIYGHLRKTPDRAGEGTALDLRPGMVITPRTILGYVQHRSLNGDGDEHLHFGVRLQTADAAQRSDAAAWFRGYDGSPSHRGWFADPEDVFLRLRLAFGLPVTVLDAGGIAFDAADGSDLAVASDRGSDAFVMMDRGVPNELRDAGGPATLRDVTFDERAEAVSDALAPSPDAFVPEAGPMPSEGLFLYEFRVQSERRISAPYRLRDLWWRPITCRNTGSVEPDVSAEGWIRCEAPRLALFDGSFFLPEHPEWGDMGQIGTVANVPTRCTPVMGAAWRLTELATRRVLYDGPASGLRCEAVGMQDRWRFPD